MSSRSWDAAPTGKFEVGDVIETSRALIRGSKRYALLLGVLFILVTMFLTVTLGPDRRAGESETIWSVLAHAVASGVFLLTYTNFGLIRAAGQPLEFGALFRHADRLPVLLTVASPYYLALSYVPPLLAWPVWALLGIALLPAVFWSYFVVDHQVGPIDAVTSSYRLVLDNLKEYALYFLLSIGLVVLGTVTLGIGMIWIAPFFWIAQGVMFASTAGLRRTYSA